MKPVHSLLFLKISLKLQVDSRIKTKLLMTWLKVCLSSPSPGFLPHHNPYDPATLEFMLFHKHRALIPMTLCLSVFFTSIPLSRNTVPHRSSPWLPALIFHILAYCLSPILLFLSLFYLGIIKCLLFCAQKEHYLGLFKYIHGLLIYLLHNSNYNYCYIFPWIMSSWTPGTLLYLLIV